MSSLRSYSGAEAFKVPVRRTSWYATNLVPVQESLWQVLEVERSLALLSTNITGHRIDALDPNTRPSNRRRDVRPSKLIKLPRSKLLFSALS